MTTTFTGVTINSVATDNIIDSNEASNGFSIVGTGTITNSPGGNNVKKGDVISVTVRWFDGNQTISQTIDATINTVNGNNFTWSITDNTFATQVAALNTGTNDSVTVQFGSVTSTPFTVNYACFLRGTRVLTRHGYCPVEELAVGDEVRTLSGGWQPLRWIGRQRITTPFGLAKGAPVRITAGAFGPALPERDVCVSQDHAIFFRNQLIPARFLVNGVTVFHDTSIENIEYFHLLLDRHAVIFSEGLATESYVPCENIDWFDNTAECPQVLLNAIRAGTAECLNECYPRKTTGPAVEAARALLARFAPADAKERAVG
ncbi:Hint domain-containing protein [Nitrosomonas communis]|uniref:Hint domain-containing protein n=1 Tax=Nitrosomonas communis TaxID=44574 RepID=A0A1H2XXI8_9PROT|nr:Hint domain-containing protein [Nitrosomonas communis]SDW97531.1 Hint domain-containing protein [Nitrosomonas communis]